MQDPRSEYTKLLAERRAEIARRERLHRSLGHGQLATAIAGAGIVWLSLFKGAFSILWVLVPIAAFTALVVIHARLLRLLECRRRAAHYFETGLARLDEKWAGQGETGIAYLDPAHPYAQDLDLFGRGSLFELLCTAQTHIGQQTLSGWLLAPAPPAELAERHAAIDELRPLVTLREDLAVLGEDARTGVDPVALARWGEQPPLLGARGLGWLLWALTALGILGAAAVAVMSLEGASVVQLPPAISLLARDIFLVMLLSNGGYLYRKRHAFEAVVAAVEEAAHELRLLSEVLVRLEREQFHAPLLARLRASLDSEGAPPSKRLAHLNRLMDYLDSRDNVFVRLAEVFLLWTPHVARKVEDWRAHSGPAVRRWLHVAGEMEALCSLACYAYEHPRDPFPEFVEEPGRLEAEGIAHPLLAGARVVANDLRLGSGLQVLVVSGSNMSGKSTLLRTLGINVVLAQAGAPVRARRLRLSPLAVGASIRLNDSLQDGISRFYAEILRLRQILDLTAGPLPVLFLVDEFLNGTNSHDRRVGAEALVRGLVKRNALGLITTHDLALAEIAESLGDHAANVHFEDHIENGAIHFDYVMRPGVVQKSNAIELMRSVGLEI